MKSLWGSFQQYWQYVDISATVSLVPQKGWTSLSTPCTKWWCHLQNNHLIWKLYNEINLQPELQFQPLLNQMPILIKKLLTWYQSGPTSRNMSRFCNCPPSKTFSHMIPLLSISYNNRNNHVVNLVCPSPKLLCSLK